MGSDILNGEYRIRTYEAIASDLQSDPFVHLGNSPKSTEREDRTPTHCFGDSCSTTKLFPQKICYCLYIVAIFFYLSI